MAEPHSRYSHERLRRFDPILVQAVTAPPGQVLFVELRNLSARSASVYLHDYIRGLVMHSWPAPDGLTHVQVLTFFRANVVAEFDKTTIYIGPRNRYFESEARMAFDYAPIKRANVIAQVLKPGSFVGPPEVDYDPDVVAALCLLRERQVITQVFKVRAWNLADAEQFLASFPSLVAVEDDDRIAII